MSETSGERARDGGAAGELLAFLPDVARLLVALTRDRRVPLRAKLVAAAAVAYVVSPLDLVPDGLPVVGQVDDVWIVAAAVRRLFGAAGYDLVRELWTGSDDGFAAVLVVAGVER